MWLYYLIAISLLATVCGVLIDAFAPQKTQGAQTRLLAINNGLWGILCLVCFAVVGPFRPIHFIFSAHFHTSPGVFYIHSLVTVAYLLSTVLLYRDKASKPQYYLLSALWLGVCCMCVAYSWVAIYLSMVLSTVPIYISCLTTQRQSTVVALRYALLGLFAMGCLLYGLSWMYGMSGLLRWSVVVDSPWLVIVYGLIYVGIFFKLGAPPMHHWVPSVYGQLSWGILGMLAVGVKVGAWLLVTRLAIWQSDYQLIVLGFWALLCVLWGSLGALGVHSLRGLFAYSAIAHAGWFVLPVAVLRGVELNRLLIYAFIFYAIASYVLLFLMQVGAWRGIRRLADLRRQGVLAGGLVLAWIAMGGWPPFGGFMVKIMILGAIAARCLGGLGGQGGYAWVLIGSGLGVLLGLYYVLRPAFFFFQGGQGVDLAEKNSQTGVIVRVRGMDWGMWLTIALGFGFLVFMLVFAEALLGFFSMRL